MEPTAIKTKSSGFTIVELLIVVVVIAILAAISVVAYTGIQTRAENAKTVNGVSAYARIFAIYAADKGVYPTTSSYPCIGGSNASGYCARVANNAPACSTSIGTAGTIPLNESFHAQLSEFVTDAPTVSDQQIACGGARFRGAYVNPNLSTPTELRLQLFLKGNVECPASLSNARNTGVYREDQATFCSYMMPNL